MEKSTILVSPIVQDKLAAIRVASTECLSILKKNKDLKDVYPYEASSALEKEISGAAERVDAALYILEDLIAMQSKTQGSSTQA